MDIEFLDPGQAPVPPEKMSFQRLTVEPFPDRRRIAVSLSVTPFLVRPSIDLEVTDLQGVKLASSSIIEATEVEMSLTLHLRHAAGDQQLRLLAILVYPDLGQVDLREAAFSFAAPASDEG